MRRGLIALCAAGLVLGAGCSKREVSDYFVQNAVIENPLGLGRVTVSFEEFENPDSHFKKRILKVENEMGQIDYYFDYKKEDLKVDGLVIGNTFYQGIKGIYGEDSKVWKKIRREVQNNFDTYLREILDYKEAKKANPPKENEVDKILRDLRV